MPLLESLRSTYYTDEVLRWRRKLLPDKTDERWTRLVTSPQEPALINLSTKMMMMRVRLMMKDSQNATRLQEAIDLAYDFFVRNQETVSEDINALFKD